MRRRRLIYLLYAICGLTGITALFYALNRQRRLIVTYHNVIPDDLFDDALHLGVSHRLSEFEKQIDVIASRFAVTTDLFATDNRSCVITFDDGYKNNTLAAASMERRGVRGLFFVPVEPIITGNTLVIDRTLRWFSYVPPGVYRVQNKVLTISDGNRREVYSDVFTWMCQNVDVWDKVPALLDACFPFTRLAELDERYEELRFQPMDREDLAELQQRGHGVGCHSWDHRPLASLHDADLWADFESCAEHKELFNVDAYSFPFGGADEVDERAMLICRSFGYRAGLANVPHGNPDPMALPRQSLSRETNRYVLDAKLSGLESFIKRVFA